MKKSRIFVGDFETTVFEGQTSTEVWASACVELFSEDVKIFHSLDETFQDLINYKENVLIYYHNLKFDGSFLLDYLMRVLELKQAKTELNNQVEWNKDYYMLNNTFKYVISDRGQWYSITIKINNNFIVIQDSLKLLPFSVKRIGNSFKTKHKKLDMEYTGFRYAGCEITDEEKEYIKNDVLVVKEALEILYQQDHTKITIGACCLSEFKSKYTKEDYEELFPDLYSIEIPQEVYGSNNVGDYVRKSYKGGWCYLARGKEKKQYFNGTTADVNSLYPSMMSSESGNFFPVGKPNFWKGDYIPEFCYNTDVYYFIRIKTRFYVKENYLPFIQIKNTFTYLGNESLETSDIFVKGENKYYKYVKDENGNILPCDVTLTLTQTDYELFREHYNVEDFEILDGCYFRAEIGLFDEYIEKYKKIKMNSKGAERELAKLFLNNLYGKMATSKSADFKTAYLDNNIIKFHTNKGQRKNAGYIPIGSAITSYARNFTIRAAQKNYYGKDKRGFIYADTDSIHCDLQPNEIKGIKIHDSAFCCWKLESCWDFAFFTRQKTYIEHVVAEDLKSIDEPRYEIKCAGMPPKCKELFLKALTQDKTGTEKYTKLEKEFIAKPLKLENFDVGLNIPTGKLLPKRIIGGIVLVDSPYVMH